MAQKFNIATYDKSGSIPFIGKRSAVQENIFWRIVQSKMKELSRNTNEPIADFDSAFSTIKTAIQSQQGTVTIHDLAFEITGKP